MKFSNLPAKLTQIDRALKLCLPVCLCLSAGSVYADYGDAWFSGVHASVEGVNPHQPAESTGNVFTVANNGEQYVANPGGSKTVTANIRILMDAEYTGRIKSYSLTLKAGVEGGAWNTYSDATVAHEFPILMRPKKLHFFKNIVVDYRNDAILHCNYMAQTLRTNGWDNANIFAEDRQIEISLDRDFNYETTLSTGANEKGKPPYEPPHLEDPRFFVICGANNIAQAPPGPHVPQREDENLLTKQAATIDYIGLNMEYPETAHCPTEVAVSAVFASREQGDFSFRFQSAFGQISPTINLTMGPLDKVGGQYTKVYHKTFHVGDVRQPIYNGEQGGIDTLLPGGDGREIDSLQTEQTIRPGHNAADGLVNDGLDPNVVYDSLRVQIMSAGPESVVASNYKDYQITCQSDPRPPVDTLGSSKELVY